MRHGFDAGNARTWNEQEKAVYETGYREGGSSNGADWVFALGEFCKLPDEVDPWVPTQVASYIRRLQEQSS
jgi:hypothetical protein